MFSAGTGSDYQVQLTASDSFATVSGGISLLPAAFALLDFDRTNKAVGIGQRAGTANAISLGLPIKMGLNRITDMGAPTEAADAATKGYVDGKRFTKTATISASWSGSAAPYTQSVTVSGILATDFPHITPVYSSTLATALAQKEAWSMVSKAEAAAGEIAFTCLEGKPATEIPIQIEVMR